VENKVRELSFPFSNSTKIAPEEMAETFGELYLIVPQNFIPSIY